MLYVATSKRLTSTTRYDHCQCQTCHQTI